MAVIRDRAKKEIAKVLNRHGVFDLEEEILSIKELAIVDRDAELPRNIWNNPRVKRLSGEITEEHYNTATGRTYSEAQQDMLKAHFVKEVIDEKTDRAQ